MHRHWIKACFNECCFNAYDQLMNIYIIQQIYNYIEKERFSWRGINVYLIEFKLCQIFRELNHYKMFLHYYFIRSLNYIYVSS
jgi:hypothetical protein